MIQQLSTIWPETHKNKAHTKRYSRKVRYIRDLNKIENIPEHEKEALRKVSHKYVFRINDYYINLINWYDPEDPIKRLVIPHVDELDDWGALDASNENAVTVSRGVQHKYTDTVLLLCNEVCGAYCRYCFRKRLFMNDNDEATYDLSDGIRYISEHPEVNNVLLTGGDPLVMSTRRLLDILEPLYEIPHVKIIRLGSKMPAFNPWRILDDDHLQRVLYNFSQWGKQIYLMAHFDHPRELTPEAIEGIKCFNENGVVCVNQCPLIKGINDDPDVLAEMFNKLSFIGCTPYYLFHGRPTAGNKPYEVPIVEGWKIYQKALKQGSGLAKRARFVASHETGKIEILAVDDDHIYMRYHEAKNPENLGRFMKFKRNDSAYWFDQLEPADDLSHV